MVSFYIVQAGLKPRVKQSSCLNPQVVRTTGMHHCTWLKKYLKKLSPFLSQEGKIARSV
jgi:hypothetical protein